jgi:DNA (cytosine-5)-methyltransferase 1
VGNAVPPKMSYAIAKAIALAEGELIPQHYINIAHSPNIEFYDLNGLKFSKKEEKPKRDVAKFKYHIPYLVISAYRVELTNYHSDFVQKSFKWDAEIHYSQGKKKANVFVPQIGLSNIPDEYKNPVQAYINNFRIKAVSFNSFQKLFCMTTAQRTDINGVGPYELLNSVKQFLATTLSEEEQKNVLEIYNNPQQLPTAIVIGYYILTQIIKIMGGLK